MATYHDFSDFPQSLKNFAIEQICTGGIVVYSSDLRTFEESESASDIRNDLMNKDKYASWRWWLQFSVGVESLVKASFLTKQISLITKNNLLSKGTGQPNQLVTADAAKAYRSVSSTHLSCRTNPWLASEFSRLGIIHPYEINTQTLGKYITEMHQLEQCGAINSVETQFLKDSLTAFSNLRRNVDAHVFLKTQVFGNMNGDLSNLYLPSINIMARILQ